MSTQECIDIMREWIAGEQIQRIPPHMNKAEWTDWNPSAGCSWDFNYYKYRVKPELIKPHEWFLVWPYSQDGMHICGMRVREVLPE